MIRELNNQLADHIVRAVESIWYTDKLYICLECVDFQAVFSWILGLNRQTSVIVRLHTINFKFMHIGTQSK
jgi:hypothetical protein